MRSIKFSSRVGKNVDDLENLIFSSRIEISSWVSETELKFWHVIEMSFQRGVYCLAEMNFQLGIPSWDFNPGWIFHIISPLVPSTILHVFSYMLASTILHKIFTCLFLWWRHQELNGLNELKFLSNINSVRYKHSKSQENLSVWYVWKKIYQDKFS